MSDISATALTTTAATSPTTRQDTLLKQILGWSRQPSTQQGLSLLIGGCVLAWMHPFGGAEGVAATVVAASLPRLWPDNTTDALQIGVLSNAIVHAAVTRKPADLAVLAESAAALLKSGSAA